MKNCLRFLLLAAIAAGALAGCSNGGSATPSSVVTPPPAKVTGVSTPKAVSVVTAN